MTVSTVVDTFDGANELLLHKEMLLDGLLDDEFRNSV